MRVLEVLDEMLEAIAVERTAVRNALGALDSMQNITVCDGSRLVTEPGANIYRFRCRADFLIPEGVRVQVQTPGAIGTGEVIDHDHALGRIDFVLREDLGETVREAKLIFDATYLLDLLANHLEFIKASAGPADSERGRVVERALAFLEGSVPSQQPTSVRRSPLSPSQNDAVSFVVGQELAYLWGPPGTGKTHTVAHLVHELVERGENVLLTAHTNVATDTALLRVLHEKPRAPLSVLRVGYYGEKLRGFGVGLDEQVDNVLRTRYQAAAAEMESFCRLVAEHATEPPAILTSAHAALPRKFRVASDLLSDLSLMEKADLTTQVAELRGILENVEQNVVDSAAIVSTTLTRLYTSRRLLRNYKADSVVIDEASIASLVLSFVAACCAKKRVVAVGDFMQLSAIVQAEQPAARRWLGRHVFASAGCDRADLEHPLRAMLYEQWRMHPHISRVVSKVFYAGKLKDSRAVEERAHSGPAWLILDTSRLPVTSQKVASGSKINPQHAAIVAKLVAKTTCREIAVIAPYRAQVQEIRSAIREIVRERLENGEVEVFTVHRFQGRDADMVIFDLVEAPGTRGRFIHELHNPDAPNLINVAVSRAKDRVVIVANLAHLAQTLGRTALVNRVFAQIRGSGGIEVVASDSRDESRLSEFLEGKTHGNPDH